MKKYQYLASWDDQTLTRVGEPVVVLGDSNVSQVEVILPSNFLLDPTGAVARMYFLLPGEKESGFETLETATKDDNGDSHVTWTIKHAHTQKGGRLAFSLTIIGDDAQWDSRTAIIPVYESRYQPESEEAEESYTGRLAALEGSMAAIRGEFAEVQEAADEATETASAASAKVDSAITKADAVDERLDNIIIESGTSEAEVVAARTNSDTGTTYNTLGARLDTEYSEIKEDLSAWKYCVSDQIDPGTMNIESGTSGNAYSSFWRYRKQARMVKIGTKPVTISFPDVSADLITSIRIYKYSEINGTVTFVGYSSAYTLTNGKYTYTPGSGVNLIKVSLTPVASSYDDFGRIVFQSEDPLEVVYNHAIGNSDYEGNITFAYVVSGNTYTSGQMILPPNYRISGNPVPLYVNVHGTGPMSKWTDIFAETGTMAKQRNRNNYEYMANEGFAVLDLYPWTSKYYSTDRQVSPLNISIHQRAFIEGIKYVCSRYNIDITNVGMSFKSLGGNLGHFFMHQTEIPIRAVAMLAPSTSYMSTVWNTFFLANSDGGVALRGRVVEILGLTNETNAQLFIDTDKGMNNATVMQFVEDHIDKFAHLNIAGYGVSGATLSNLFEWSHTGVSTLPQWLQDRGFTTIASKWTTSPARGVPSVINHPELSKHSNVPVKFWQAPDDVNTSFHVNYTIYQWLLNSGTDVDFRVMPENTGGHHAIDTDDDALKNSGTTRLGIAYTDIATAYVEMADFFYNKMTL